MNIPMSFATALVVSLGTTPIAIAVLRRSGTYDNPTERSSHSVPTPRGGGVATAIAAMSGLVIGWAGTPGPLISIAFIAGGFGLVGLIDDLYELDANLRLAAQVGLGSVGAFLLLNDTNMHVITHVLAGIVVVLWLMSFVNAFNFMDGVNGMSVVQSTVAGLAWAALGWMTGETFLIVAGLAQAGATLGFAPYNVPVARVFLGDVGSYFLGGWMAALVVIGLRAGVAPEAIIAPLGLYLLDTGTTLVWRIRTGEQWRTPHRHHVYQRLTDGGWSHLQTVLFAAGIIALCALLGGLATSGSLSGRLIGDAGLVAAIIAYLDWPDHIRHRSNTTPT